MAILKRYISPRQKMINLMYIVLMGMLALNVEPAGSTAGFPMTGTAPVKEMSHYHYMEDNEVKVADMEAVIIPSSQTVFQGQQMEARIMMAMVDTVTQPKIIIDSTEIQTVNGLYRFECPRAGRFALAGEVQVKNISGGISKRPFRLDYQVLQRTFAIGADLVNVLYAGYDNPITVSIPGVPQEQVQVHMSNGSVRKTTAGKFIARPESKSEKTILSVSFVKDGKTVSVGTTEYRVRPIPDPLPYLVVSDGDRKTRYKGGRVSRSQLTAPSELRAAVDDGILDIPFRVTSFETVFFDQMGNAIPAASDGSSFSRRQRDIIAALPTGKRFYISKVRAVGPDGIARNITTPMEVIIR